MTTAILYGLSAVMVFFIGLYGMICYRHFLKKAIAINIMGTGIFLLLTALSTRSPDSIPDPVPHGMVLTGIVVSVGATAFILLLGMHLFVKTGNVDFSLIKYHEKEKEKE